MLLKLALFAMTTGVISTRVPVSVEQSKKLGIVCASNGENYMNIYNFLIKRKELLHITGERIKILKLGICDTEPDIVVIPPHCLREGIAPVCGSNGLTHRNICVFRINRRKLLERTGETLRIIKLGECLEIVSPKVIKNEPIS